MRHFINTVISFFRIPAAVAEQAAMPEAALQALQSAAQVLGLRRKSGVSISEASISGVSKSVLLQQWTSEWQEAWQPPLRA